MRAAEQERPDVKKQRKRWRQNQPGLDSSHLVFIDETGLSTKMASLYLPPYSPDLNPIEQVFTKLKAHLREKAARTLPDLQQAVAAALNRFRPDQCQNFFRQAQYLSI
jgi:transposase